eukprot:TRINITY_DN21080_c0_g1_i1.p1 TRINITY_DN21080_c0_g1~~TRINITY_DN21080_c0_g1_i1.p1  ORF type:complete len:259 (+),score=46.64 TRINITY_DN21080_c0_g1_i1:41-778(+)
MGMAVQGCPSCPSLRHAADPVTAPASTSQRMAVRSDFWGYQQLPVAPVSVQHRQHRKQPLGVRMMAISRTKKEETVEMARQQLESCYMVAGFKFTGLSVKHLQELRRSLPESAKLVVAKNKLIGRAIEGTPWEVLQPCLKGMNAWLFVQGEEIPAAITPFRTMQKELKLESNDFTGAVFEGKYYSTEEFKTLETLPSKGEIYAKLLGSLQSPAIGLVATLQGPARNLVLTLKAHVAKLEEAQASS